MNSTLDNNLNWAQSGVVVSMSDGVVTAVTSLYHFCEQNPFVVWFAFGLFVVYICWNGYD